jgi:hypothetical protein
MAFNYLGLKAGDCSHDHQTKILPFQYSRSAEVCSGRPDNGGASSRVELPRLREGQARLAESGDFSALYPGVRKHHSTTKSNVNT